MVWWWWWWRILFGKGLAVLLADFLKTKSPIEAVELRRHIDGPIVPAVKL